MALERLSMWLWDNPPKADGTGGGLHCTVDINFDLPNGKRAMFSLGGENTRNQWKAYNDSQPTQLKEYFAYLKNTYREEVKRLIEEGNTVRISKLAMNTGNKGRRVMNGMILLVSKGNRHTFTMHIGEHRFDGEFDASTETAAQRNNTRGGIFQGEWRWQKPRAEDDLWEAAY